MKISVDVSLTPAQLAEAFCGMDDEKQAQFFIEAARLAHDWPDGGASYQWTLVGRHLRVCPCSTQAARDMPLAIVAGIHDGGAA